MKPYLTSGIAALIVSAGFAGAAAAQDMYSNPEGLPQIAADVQLRAFAPADLDGGQDEGDYYDGAYRPHN